MSVNVTVDLSGIVPKVSKATLGAQHILDEKVLKDSNFYIPADTWNLRDSGVTHSRIGKGVIVWSTPYAKKMFYGVGFKFSKDKNPNAQARWFYKAQSVHGAEWLQVAQKAVEKGL